MTAVSYLANPSTTRKVLQRFGLATKKALGQNFLVNDAIIAKICELSDVQEGDYVLEVGPGIGTLTVGLLQHASLVRSIERDSDLPQVLAETCQQWEDSFSLVEKDALDLVESDIAHEMADGVRYPNKWVSNLPYAVAATLILQYFQDFESLESATVMVQAEVADRIAASIGTKNYGAYTVKLSLYTQVTGRFKVGPQNFFPPPRVDSAVIRLDRRSEGRAAKLSAFERRQVCTMADAAFTNRRKTLSNSCKTYFSGRGELGAYVAEHLPELFETAGIDAKRRGESLSLEEFIDLGLSYTSLCKRFEAKA